MAWLLLGVLSGLMSALAGFAGAWVRRERRHAQDRRRFEMALIQAEGAVQSASAEARKMFRDVVERIPVGVVIRRGHTIRYVNPSLLQTLGYTQTEMLDRPVLDFFLEADRAEIFTSTQPVGESYASPAPAPFRAVHRDGSLVWLEAMPLRLVDYEGKPSVLITFRDVTERRSQQERMQFTDRMAAIGTLASSVAHEINNPLSWLTGNIELAVEGISATVGDPDSRSLDRNASRVHALLTDALDAADRVRAIVADLKTFSMSNENTS